MLIVLILLLAVLCAANYYIALRLWQGARHLFPCIRLWPILVIFFLLLVVMGLSFSRSFLPFGPGAKHVIGVIGSYWMAIFIYLLLFTMVADLVYWISRLFRGSFAEGGVFRLVSGIVILLFTAGTVFFGSFHTRQVKHVSYDISLESLPVQEEMTLVLISDLHLGAIGSEARLEGIVREINSRKPDLVCIAGDFFDTDFSAIQDPDKAVALLQTISATHGVYACLGNHDAGPTAEKMLTFLKSCNIRVLREEATVIDGKLILAGRLDASPIGGYGEAKRQEFSAVLADADPNLPVVVMDHNPANIGGYGEESDLILSGHTHKGQLFPANFMTDLLYEVDYGYYRKDSSSPHVIVTSGVGFWGMPIRVGTDCEIVTIILHP